jgi:putative ABC transport system permease protein
MNLTIKNMARNKLRTALTVAAIALPMFVFTVARSFVDLFGAFLRESDKQMRVAVHQKLTYTTYLPQRIREEIEQLAPPGYITAICRASWFGGRVEGAQAHFPSMAMDRDTFPIVYSEFGMTPEEVALFQAEKRGAIVGKPTANRMNWKVGDRVTLVGGVPPFPRMEFVIVAIPAKLEAPWFYFGLDYLNEVYERAMLKPVGVHNFWMKCATPEARQWALSEIDKHFTNTDYETRTEMESTFIAAFTKSGGDWIGLVWNVGQLIVLVAVAVAFNTMSMSFRERTRELAVMRALGFSAGRIVRLVLSEGFLLGLFGGLIAVGPIYAWTTSMDVVIPGVDMPVRIAEMTAAIAMVVAVACGVLASIVPAILAGRIKVASALRKVV